MMSQRRWVICGVFIGLLFLGACASKPEAVKQPTLNAPVSASLSVRSAMSEGNQLFASGRWEAAKAQYEKVLQEKKTIAEAHYNLALVFDRLGKREEARPHYMEAANLAPGNQVIWNSPVLRRYGDVAVEKSNAAAPALPSLGGAGGALGGGGGGGAPGGY